MTQLPVESVLELFGDFKVFLDVADAVSLHDDDVAPVQKVVDGECSYKEEPKPEENEDFLVEEIDWQDALNRETLNILELTDLKVAECDTWETWAFPPWVVRMETLQNLKSVNVVIGGHKGIQKKELTDDINNVEDFDKQEKSRQERTTTFAADDTTNATDTFSHGRVLIPTIVPFTVQPFVNMSCQMLNGFLSC